jgi:hypothetical protein
MSGHPDGDGLFEFVGGVIALTAAVAFAVGKLVFVLTKEVVKCVAEEREDRQRASRAKVIRRNVEASDVPLVSPWIGANEKCKLVGTIDVMAGVTSGNAIILHTSKQSAGGSRTFHLEPVSTFEWTFPPSSRTFALARDLSCFHLRVFTQDSRIASCYAVGSPLILYKNDSSDSPPVLYCADTVHALLVYVLWPRATIEYHIGNNYRINIPKNCHLSSPPTPQELELHGLRITAEGDPDFGQPPMIQSCWDCVHWYWTPRRGVNPSTGTRWCIHGTDFKLIPERLFENRLSAIVTPYFVRFTSSKRSVDKKRKTYQLFVEVGRTIGVPRIRPAVTDANPTTFTTPFRTTPVSSDNVRFMSRGASPKSPADVRWETIMGGEPCSHVSSVSPPTVLEEVAPDRAAFLASLDGLRDIVQGRGLVPIAGIGGMDDVERSALSLSVADQGYWVYWKSSNQCLGCAVSLVQERFKRGTAVIFTA